MNPFKFGTIVSDDFFTDRVNELEEVKQKLNSENHLVLISPRRFGKSSLIQKALKQIGRPSITIDLMNVLNVEGFAAILLKEIFKLYKMEKIKHMMSHFRFIPTVSTNPMSDTFDVSFQPAVNSTAVLEDAMALLQKVTTPEERIILVLDEFQEINEIQKDLDKQLRAIMQKMSCINFIFMGSQESMMTDIFENKKSPFYHFGQRMNLKKIPYDDFYSFIKARMLDKPGVPASEIEQVKDKIIKDILQFTNIHPYYTQQLASAVYDLQCYQHIFDNVVDIAIEQQIQAHDLDYERLWQTMNRTDRKILIDLAKENNPLQDRISPTSTSFSAMKRLVKKGYVNKVEKYEVEDPFFARWILARV